MTGASVRRRRLVVRFSRGYGQFIAWGRRHRWIFVVALVWGFGIPTFLLPDKIAESKDGKLSVWAEAYNGIMGSQAVSEHRPVIDKVFGSSLHLFRTATNRYDNFRTPEQKRLYVSAGMAEGCTVQQLNEVVRHMENYISRFDQVDMFRTRITSYDNAQIEITFKPEFEYGPFPAMLKQELTSAAINFGGATWYIRGHRRQHVQQQRRQQLPFEPVPAQRLQLRPALGLCRRADRYPVPEPPRLQSEIMTATHGRCPTTNSTSATTTNESPPRGSTWPIITGCSVRCFSDRGCRRFTMARNSSRSCSNRVTATVSTAGMWPMPRYASTRGRRNSRPVGIHRKTAHGRLHQPRQAVVSDIGRVRFHRVVRTWEAADRTYRQAIQRGDSAHRFSGRFAVVRVLAGGETTAGVAHTAGRRDNIYHGAPSSSNPCANPSSSS